MIALTDIEAANLLGIRLSSLPSWMQGLAITDAQQPDDSIVWVNERFAAMTGYDREEVIGRNCRFLQGPATCSSTVAAIREAVSRHKLFSGAVLNYRKDGTPFWNHLALGPIMRGERGRYLVGVQRNVSDLRMA